MAVIGSLVVNLLANTSQFSNGLKKGAADAKGFEAKLRGLNSAASKVGLGLSAVGATVAAGAFLKGAISEMMEAEKIGKQLETVIKSTGGAAGLTKKDIDALASSLQQTTTYADDTTKAASALLLTFTNIKGDVFKEAIKAAQDMSTAMGTDLNASVMQLGKALNDPIAGVSKLTKVGVTFTEQQKEQIKSFVKLGDVASAQGIILKELSVEFGGSAAAEMDTYAGKIKSMTNAWNDFKESVGGTVVPAAAGVLQWISDTYGSWSKFWENAGVKNFRMPGDKTDASIDYSKSNSYLKDIPKAVDPLGFGNAFNGIGKKPDKLAKNVAENFSKALGTAFDAKLGAGNLANLRSMQDGAAKAKKQEFADLLMLGFDGMLGGGNLANLRSMQGKAGAAAKPIPVVLKDRQFSSIDPGFRGSQSHLEAIIKQKGGMLGASFVDLQKQQVRHLAAIERNTGGGGVGVGVV